jgi:multisubunit Na+/H+ antiporter MnhE subunit
VSSRPLAVVLLTLVYALTLASLDPLDLALGAVLAIAATVGLRGAPGAQGRGAREAGAGDLGGRILAFPLLAAGLLGEVLRGTWDVLLRAVHVRPIDRPGIVLVPIEERTPLGVAVAGLATTLSPGSVLVDVDWEREAMLVHVIDATDPASVRAAHRRFYERYQRRVFP